MECRRSDCGKSHCGACCGGICQGGSLLLTREEVKLLSKFAELAFLPVACREDNRSPIFLTPEYTQAAISTTITGLWQKKLIRVDYDIPMLNFDYADYGPYAIHGSMAITAAGQDALDSLEIQGCNR
ncbi:hypothetical protein SDC9_52901 [bioreactor metagenome]|uniref:Uncharacterized protein n=1 Tax=bioreactor metagenome TaxID=1076179 RepID=A0A644WSD0_9ZZZZ